jgi:hypothetical protein
MKKRKIILSLLFFIVIGTSNSLFSSTVINNSSAYYSGTEGGVQSLWPTSVFVGGVFPNDLKSVKLFVNNQLVNVESANNNSQSPNYYANVLWHYSSGSGSNYGLNYTKMLTNYVYNNSFNSNSDYVKFVFEFERSYDVFELFPWPQNVTYINKRSVEVVLYHAGKINLNQTTLCSGLQYSYSDLFSPFPLTHDGSNYDFTPTQLSNNNSVTFTQPIDNSITILYSATINHNNVANNQIYRTWVVPIHELKIAKFINTPQAQGVVTSLTAPSLMSSYIYTNGGVLEYSGPGIIVNGVNTFFNPTTANVGNNLMYIRTNNQGCQSEWQDTLFYITPIVTNIATPKINVPAAFGTDGLIYASNPSGGNNWTIDFNKKFHFGCSNKNYLFSLINPQSNISYEWKVLFHNAVVSSGFGNSINVQMPDRNSVDTDVNSLPFPLDSFANNIYVPCNYLLSYGGNVDVDANGNVDAMFTSYLGDPMFVRVRGKNIIGQYGEWTQVIVGVVPSPEIQQNKKICYDNNPILTSLSETPIYLNYISPLDIRSSKWDVNVDGLIDYTNVDSLNYTTPINNKAVIMKTQIIDSIKYYGINTINYQYYTDFKTGGEVCYSEIDTIKIIKKPVLNTLFNAVDTLAIGTAVRSVLQGQWFDPEADSISWVWSDNSLPYSNDTLWHYLNDLGAYSLSVYVQDGFGCSKSENYANYWYVNGVLDVDENDVQNLKMYPVPVVDVLTVELDQEVELIKILNNSGQLVYSTTQKIIDMSSFEAGGYVVEITTKVKQYHKKIVKL